VTIADAASNNGSKSARRGGTQHHPTPRRVKIISRRSEQRAKPGCQVPARASTDFWVANRGGRNSRRVRPIGPDNEEQQPVLVVVECSRFAILGGGTDVLDALLTRAGPTPLKIPARVRALGASQASASRRGGPPGAARVGAGQEANTTLRSDVIRVATSSPTRAGRTEPVRDALGIPKRLGCSRPRREATPRTRRVATERRAVRRGFGGATAAAPTQRRRRRLRRRANVASAMPTGRRGSRRRVCDARIAKTVLQSHERARVAIPRLRHSSASLIHRAV